MAGSRVEYNGASIWHERRGSGPPLVLLHAGIADSRSWEPQLPTFAQSFDVVTWDRRGFGRTARPDVSFSPHDDLRGLLDALEIESAHLLGCSQGGKITVDFALENPDRVLSLTLVSSALSGFEFDDWPADVEAEYERVDATGDLELMNAFEVDLWVVGTGRSRADVDRGVLELCLDMNRIALQAPEVGEERPLAPPAAGRLHEVRARSLVITGDRDVAATLASSAALARGIPSARAVTMPDTAHLPNLERPGEFNRLVLEFLDGD